MIDMMRHVQRWLAGLSAVFAMALSPALAMAQSSLTENSKVYDGRLEGYSHSVTLDGGSTALTWLLLIVLAALILGVLFKSSNRTHLD